LKSSASQSATVMSTFASHGRCAYQTMLTASLVVFKISALYNSTKRK